MVRSTIKEGNSHPVILEMEPGDGTPLHGLGLGGNAKVLRECWTRKEGQRPPLYKGQDSSLVTPSL